MHQRSPYSPEAEGTKSLLWGVGHLEGVQVQLHVEGLAGSAHAIEAAGLLQAPVVHLPAQARPRVLCLPQQHLCGKHGQPPFLDISTLGTAARLPESISSCSKEEVVGED